MTYTAPSPTFLKTKTGTDSSIIAGELAKIAASDAAGLKVAKGTLKAGNANTFAFAWENPEASKIIVTRVLINITTAGGTDSSVLDVGVVADAASTADTLIDGLDLNATGIFDNITDKGDNG